MKDPGVALAWENHRVDTDDLAIILNAGESQTVEFKESFSLTKEAMRAVAAFANQVSGGHVVFGVDDAGNPVNGFKVRADRQEKLANTLRQSVICMSDGHPLHPDIFEFSNPPALVIRIEGLDPARGHFMCNGVRYERVGKTTQSVDIDYRQLVKAYNENIWDDGSDEHMAYRFCPKCGHDSFDRGSWVSPRDDVWYWIRCKNCQWEDASE